MRTSRSRPSQRCGIADTTVFSVAERDPGLSDESVAAICDREERILLTLSYCVSCRSRAQWLTLFIRLSRREFSPPVCFVLSHATECGFGLCQLRSESHSGCLRMPFAQTADFRRSCLGASGTLRRSRWINGVGRSLVHSDGQRPGKAVAMAKILPLRGAYALSAQASVVSDK